MTKLSTEELDITCQYLLAGAPISIHDRHHPTYKNITDGKEEFKNSDKTELLSLLMKDLVNDYTTYFQNDLSLDIHTLNRVVFHLIKTLPKEQQDLYMTLYQTTSYGDRKSITDAEKNYLNIIKDILPLLQQQCALSTPFGGRDVSDENEDICCSECECPCNENGDCVCNDETCECCFDCNECGLRLTICKCGEEDEEEEEEEEEEEYMVKPVVRQKRIRKFTEAHYQITDQAFKSDKDKEEDDGEWQVLKD